jgi:hypothetical protein
MWIFSKILILECNSKATTYSNCTTEELYVEIIVEENSVWNLKGLLYAFSHSLIYCFRRLIHIIMILIIIIVITIIINN